MTLEAGDSLQLTIDVAGGLSYTLPDDSYIYLVLSVPSSFPSYAPGVEYSSDLSLIDPTYAETTEFPESEQDLWYFYSTQLSIYTPAIGSATPGYGIGFSGL